MSDVNAQIREALSGYLADPGIIGLTEDLSVLARTRRASGICRYWRGPVDPTERGSSSCPLRPGLERDVGLRCGDGSGLINRAYQVCGSRYPTLRETMWRLRNACGYLNAQS